MSSTASHHQCHCFQMKCQNGGFAVALVLAALILQHPVQGQDFFTIARMARATADSEPPSFGATTDTFDAIPAAGGGLSANQQQTKNHGNRRVSGERAARGRTIQRTGRAFGALSGMTSDQIRETPAASRALSMALSDVCPRMPVCEQFARYRTADGTCNNLRRPMQGASDTIQPRFLQPAYQNGEDTPRMLAADGSMLPSPRTISNLVHRASAQTKFERGLTTMVMQWGQFTDHDIVITPTVKGIECCMAGPQPEDCFNIAIPPGDPQFPGTCMPLVRSLEGIPTDCVPGKRQQTNLLTSYIDASNVYGSTQEAQTSLRSGTEGKLLTSANNLLPEDPDPMACTKEAPGDYCLRAGDERVSEQPILSTIHTVFLREHNYIAGRLRQINPEWDDERLFQETRKIVAAEMQHITYNEYLPIVLGRRHANFFGLRSRTYGHSNVYNPNIDASIVNVFAAASFRFGHSQIPNIAAKARQDFIPFGERNLENTFFKPNLYLSEPNGEGVNGISRWTVSARGLVTDSQIQRSVQDLLFLDANGVSFDLASLNIQRGRDHGLPPYNSYRVLCGLPAVVHWGRGPGGLVDHNDEDALKLQSAYRSPADIDIFTGTLSERPVYGGLVGPTNACILGNQFRRLKLGDRFFYENPFSNTGFTLDQLTEIKKISLSKILCRNMDMFAIQPAAFRTPSFWNRYLPCVSLPDINLDLWRGRRIDETFGMDSQQQTPFSPLSVLRQQNIASFLTPTNTSLATY